MRYYIIPTIGIIVCVSIAIFALYMMNNRLVKNKTQPKIDTTLFYHGIVYRKQISKKDTAIGLDTTRPHRAKITLRVYDDTEYWYDLKYAQPTVGNNNLQSDIPNGGLSSRMSFMDSMLKIRLMEYYGNGWLDGMNEAILLHYSDKFNQRSIEKARREYFAKMKVRLDSIIH